MLLSILLLSRLSVTKAGLIGGLGTGEILLIALIVLLIFGGRKIPELMKGIGKGVKSFKDGMSGLEEDINKPGNTDKSNEPGKDKTTDKAG